MRIAAPIVALALAALTGLLARSAPSADHRSPEPAPLRGVPLGNETGLRLLVADNPPFVLDVDRASVTPVPGVPAISRGTLSVVGVAGRAAVVLARSAWMRADIYGVRGVEAPVSSLGTGTDAVPAADGRAVWIKSSIGRTRCALREVRLDGRQIRAPRGFPCAWIVQPAGSLGLVARRTRVFDPVTRRTIYKARWGVLAAAGKSLVLAGPGKQLTLIDVATRAQRVLRWPSILTGLDRPAVDPRGRFVALAFASPAWKGGGKQVLGVWLLDVQTGKLAQLPGMPAFVALKQTSMAWTDDGRLVLLGETTERDFVAVWRPGQRRLAVKTVRLPERTSGSDSFAPLR